MAGLGVCQQTSTTAQGRVSVGSTGNTTVKADGLIMNVVGDTMVGASGPRSIATGSVGVFCHGIQVARITSVVGSDDSVVTGSSTTFVRP